MSRAGTEQIVHRGRRDVIIVGRYGPIDAESPIEERAGEQIRALRLDHGLTLRRCANAMNISPTRLSHCEQGQALLSLDERARLYRACAETYGVGPDGRRNCQLPSPIIAREVVASPSAEKGLVAP